jgi:hypothetical protein
MASEAHLWDRSRDNLPRQPDDYISASEASNQFAHWAIRSAMADAGWMVQDDVHPFVQQSRVIIVERSSTTAGAGGRS